MRKSHWSRPYITEYYDSESAAGKKPFSTGYARTLQNAMKNIAVHLVFRDCRLGVIRSRRTGARLESLKASDLKFKHYEEDTA